MFIFADRHRAFEVAGFLILSAYLFLFIFGLKPFQAGIWMQTEPTLLAVFVIAACNALWLFIGCFKKLLSLQPLHLLWKVMILWLLVQYAVTIVAPSGWRSWFGAPEIGIGTAWHMSVLLCALLCYPFWHMPQYRIRILLVACASLLAECTMHYLHAGEFIEEWSPWRPALWPDYMAFMVGYLWIAAHASGHARKPAILCGIIILMYGVLFVSQNLAAMALFALAMLATTIATYPRYSQLLKNLFLPSRTWRMLVIISCLIPLVWIIGSPLVQQLPQDDVGVITGLAARGESMGARAEINQVAISTLLHEPSRLLLGKGWGHFTQDSFKYALVEGVHVFENGVMRPNSNNVTGASFHSHSEPLEVILALGLVGLLIWFALPFIAIRNLPDAMFWGIAPMLAAIMMLQYFWFYLPQVLAYQAIMLCALCGLMSAANGQTNTPKHYIYVFLGFAGLMAWSATQQYAAIRYADELHYIPREEKAAKYDKEWLARDIFRDASRFNVSAENFAVWAWDAHFRKHGVGYDQEWLKNYLEVAQAIENSPTLGARYNMLALWLKYKLLMDFTDDAHTSLRKQATSTLEASVYRLTRIAPEREDLAATFLANLGDYTQNNAGKQVEILGNILAIYPEHRSALWLLGNIFITDPAFEADGRRMIAEAKARQVEHVYPITDEELKATQP